MHLVKEGHVNQVGLGRHNLITAVQTLVDIDAAGFAAEGEIVQLAMGNSQVPVLMATIGMFEPNVIVNVSESSDSQSATVTASYPQGINLPPNMQLSEGWLDSLQTPDNTTRATISNESRAFSSILTVPETGSRRLMTITISHVRT